MNGRFGEAAPQRWRQSWMTALGWSRRESRSEPRDFAKSAPFAELQFMPQRQRRRSGGTSFGQTARTFPRGAPRMQSRANIARPGRAGHLARDSLDTLVHIRRAQPKRGQVFVTTRKSRIGRPCRPRLVFMRLVHCSHVHMVYHWRDLQ